MRYDGQVLCACALIRSVDALDSFAGSEQRTSTSSMLSLRWRRLKDRLPGLVVALTATSWYCVILNRTAYEYLRSPRRDLQPRTAQTNHIWG